MVPTDKVFCTDPTVPTDRVDCTDPMVPTDRVENCEQWLLKYPLCNVALNTHIMAHLTHQDRKHRGTEQTAGKDFTLLV